MIRKTILFAVALCALSNTQARADLYADALVATIGAHAHSLNTETGRDNAVLALGDCVYSLDVALPKMTQQEKDDVATYLDVATSTLGSIDTVMLPIVVSWRTAMLGAMEDAANATDQTTKDDLLGYAVYASEKVEYFATWTDLNVWVVFDYLDGENGAWPIIKSKL